MRENQMSLDFTVDELTALMKCVEEIPTNESLEEHRINRHDLQVAFIKLVKERERIRT